MATAGFTAADWNRVRQAVLRAGIDVAEAMRARCAGDFVHEPCDPRLRRMLDEIDRPAGASAAAGPSAAPRAAASGPAAEREAASAPMPACDVSEPRAGAPDAAPAAPPLSALWPDFCAQQVASASWEKQAASQARPSFRLFVEICGDRPPAAYTRKDVGYFKDRVERLPASYGKAALYRGKSVAEILVLRAGPVTPAEGKPITPKTVKRHFSSLSAFWQAAEARGEVAENIFRGFRFGAARKASEQRQMWERAGLARFFATPIWAGCLSKLRRAVPGRMIIRDEKFWLPLIAVFSGMRQEEICQLSLEDVREADGIAYFDVNDREARTLKNRTAVRRVPVHDELVRLGLLRRVEALRGRRETRLFPELRGGGADDRLGHAFAKGFTRYRRLVGVYRPGLDFHSFRHSATTFMHQAGVEGSVIDHVTGHVTAGETARYTKGSSLAQLRAAVMAIDIGVDLSRLHQVEG